MKGKKLLKVAAIPAILLIGLIVMQALGSTRKQSQRRERTPEPRAVETQLLVFSELTLRVEGDGVVESERTLDVISEASGRVTFAKNDLKDGTYARAGEVVLRIDSRDVLNDLYALRSDFMNAVASVLPELQIDDARIYRRWFDYFQSLDIDRPVPELPDITNAQEKIKVSTRNIISLYYEVNNLEIQLSKHTVRAPFAGYITSNGVIAGSFVSTGQQLLRLTDPKNLVVTVPLLVEESKSIDFAQAPRVTIYADEGSDDTKLGRITRKQATLERNSQTLNVFVTFTNNDLNPYFLPGSYVHVEIDGKTLRDVTPIPRHLLDDRGYVFTMEDGSLNRQQLEVVAYQSDLAIVGNSVPDGTVIVTTILQKPLIGMAIRSVNMPEYNPGPDSLDPGGAEGELAGEQNDGESGTAGG